MEILQCLFLVDTGMTEDISAEDRGETRVGKGERVSAAETHELAALRVRDLTGRFIGVQSKYRVFW